MKVDLQVDEKFGESIRSKTITERYGYGEIFLN